jgi:pyridoxamine 5'-phosphate oxidase
MRSRTDRDRLSFPAMKDPLREFDAWFEAAKKSDLEEPTAMALATSDETGAPHVRMVLLKAADERGFVFYTNLESPKASDIKSNPRAELCFYWPPNRQIRIRGSLEAVSPEEADAYFATRPRVSQLGAWASRQSQPLGAYAELERAVAACAIRFGLKAVPRPPHWSGFRLVPAQIEFWEQRPFRLHNRVRFTRTAQGWDEQRLFP